MPSRLITIGCLQMGKARRSAEGGLLGYLSVGEQPQQLLYNLHCAAPQSYCKFFGNGFSVAPVNELSDTDASGYLCPGRSTRVGPDLFYLILPAKNILLCSACRSPTTSKLGLEHTAIVRDTPVNNCKDAACSATLACTVCNVPWPFFPRVSVSPSFSTH